MRHCVRRARLHIVRKLIRQVGMIRSKKGDDKQLEKNKRKAEKLCQEVAALKKIPDDDVTRFSITNQQSLGEILSDMESGPEKSVLARMSQNKIIADRVRKFKEKFPNYEDHLGLGKRKLHKLKRKAGKVAKREAKQNVAPNSSQEEVENRDLNDDDESVRSGAEIENAPVGKSENESMNETIEPRKEREKIINKEQKKTEKKKPKETFLKRDNKLQGISVASKEAAVKSFTQFLEENDEEISPGPEKTEEETEINGDKIEVEKEVDSFFVTENGEGEYLSVVVPRSKLTEEENDEENSPADAAGRRWKSFNGNARETSTVRNGRFFDKIDKTDWKKSDRSNAIKTQGNRRENGARKRSRGDFPPADDKWRTENMHPSWAAKKKQQEVLKLGFQGKKIVFDDA